MTFEFSFHLYGFFVGLGIVAGFLVIEKVQKKFSLAISYWPVVDFFPWVLISGLIGARLYHILDYWQYYSQNPVEVFYLWHGGLGIYGALFGGVIGIWLYLKLKTQSPKLKTKTQNLKLNKTFFSYLDLLVFGLPLGQAIGRLGNYFNQELYGLPTNLPWGIYISPKNRIEGFKEYDFFQPLFAYEAFWDMAIFIILIKMLNSKLKCQNSKPKLKTKNYFPPGIFFFSYLFLYGFGRFWLEFLRINPWRVGGINLAQGISLGLATISLVWFAKTKLFKLND